MQKYGPEYLQSTEKRTLDKIGGAAVAVALAPMAVGVGVACAIDTGEINPLFVQERTGGQAESFEIYKFRTLRQAMGSRAITKTYGTFDPRTSPFGQFIRQTGLDESPQVINVLKGDMSLVGPRPLIQEDVELYEQADSSLFDDWYEHYQQVKPGLTGKSQIFRHHYKGVSTDMRKSCMRMDLDYFENATLKQDIKIILATPIQLIQANIAVEETAMSFED